MTNTFYYKGWLLFVFLSSLVHAQLPSVSFETITIQDGLPSNTTYFATQDKQGFMWFGTRTCPTRYDGSTFRSFLTPETNLVTGIAADSQNTIWISSDRNGICQIKSNSMNMQSLYKPGHTPSGPQSGSFFIDSYDKGWYSDMQGINQMDLTTHKTKYYPLRQTNYVWIKASFLEDSQHTLWAICTDNGLFRYDRNKDTFVCVLGADSKIHGRNDPIVFTKGCVDSKGMLWLGSENRGLIQYNPHTNTYQTFQDTDRPLAITCVREGLDENNQIILWIGTHERLWVYRPEQQKFYDFTNLFPDAYNVYYIFREKTNGIVWVCTSEGILKYHPQSNLIHKVQLPINLLQFSVTVNVITPDQRDSTGQSFWLGLSRQGLLHWNRKNGQFRHIHFPQNLHQAEINWIDQRPNGILWIGVNRWDYKRGGLFVYDPDSDRFLDTPLVRSTIPFYSVSFFMYGFFDKSQRLWIGNSDEGIHVLDTKTTRDVTPWNKVAQQQFQHNNNLINDLYQDRQGHVWLGTYQGLYLADEKQKRFISLDSIAIKNNPGFDRTVNSIYEDHQGHIWAARWGSITETDSKGNLLTLLTSKDGLYDRENNGIAEDTLGNIWIGNFEGLHCYNPFTKRIIRFTINDGLSQNNTLRRVFTTPNKKELLIGQKNGFDIVNVSNLMQKPVLPTLAISSFQVHDKVLQTDFTQPIKLERHDNAFTVNFVALNYTKLQNNQYAYLLEGFEEKWHQSGSAHVAYYTNLDPGSYTLRLKAGDAFGNWNPHITSIHITILPAFYETWWFRIMMAVAVLTLLYALYHYRVQQILQLQHVRNRISADLHDEIGSSLSGISIMGMMVKQNLQNPNVSSSFLDKMMEEVHRISGSMDDIVWSINPHNDELSILVSRMVRYASELLEARNISYHIQVPDSIENLKLAMEKRRDFYLIFKEAVNNLVKYSHCSQARIVITVDHHHLQMTIEDDGVGFDPTTHQDRNGLRNLQKRAESLKGSLSIRSALGQGTTIRLQFPVIH
ncbi:two-component regulator propeller domain-containing protein [Cytophagaceae bacterium DM2B3-1]|uniref:Two-component regulator propeller domain-containing protein n=1 Tax=Xanthocytophaga flava TaxID=3048013 RepID=A0ABT7CNE3_9BACT|nr:two-component regulator propeller domain-containing protein [Xanthocytophaga flavus]MDJ1495274.1 two-component regulator propeller domain-containing protein [Xanthocytophaga flavus]